jgi:mono/diheme cytochrome c family protein
MNKNSYFRKALNGVVGIALTALLFSCGKADPNSPGNEFMPDMYRSPSLEAYRFIVTNAGDTILSARTPAKGTISRNNIPGFDPNRSYAESAGLPIDLPNLEKNRASYETAGKELYEKYCIHCHGATGAGDGKVAAKLPGPPPAYNGPQLKNLPPGQIFYSITKGKGYMGSHASQLTVEERWKVVCYVQQLQGPKDTAAVAVPPVNP